MAQAKDHPPRSAEHPEQEILDRRDEFKTL